MYSGQAGVPAEVCTSRQAGTELHNHGDDFLDDNELSNYLDNIDTGANGLAVIYHFHDTGLGWKEVNILFLDEDGEVTDDSEELLDVSIRGTAYCSRERSWLHLQKIHEICLPENRF